VIGYKSEVDLTRERQRHKELTTKRQIKYITTLQGTVEESLGYGDY